MQNVDSAFAALRAKGHSSYEYRFLHGDGTYHWMYDEMSLVPGSGDEPAEVFGVWLDVTPRRQAEEELRAAQERVQRIVAASPAMIYSLEVSGTAVRPVWVSENLERLLGYAPEESFAKSWWNERVHPEDWGRARAGQLELLSSGEHAQEYRFRHRDGSYRWVRDEARVVERCGGEPLEVVGSWSDVTERRMAEEARLTERRRAEEELRVAKEAAERANRAKSEFLSHMSHELRTPLSSVLGFAELLADGSCGEVNARQAEYLENVLSSGRDLLSLINDLLDLVKIEAGRVDLELMETDLGPLVTDITDAVRALALKKDLRLTLHLAEPLPPAAVDPRRFKQMLLNLLSNAIKFTPAGGSVVVELRREESIRPRGGDELAGPWLRVDVADTGIGIAPQDLDGLFQVFEQVRNAQRAMQPGTGLGLALTRLLAGMHGGHAWAASAGPQRGSTFSLALPLHHPEAGSSAASGGGAER
jgi:PAS domain S-box-containing protein